MLAPTPSLTGAGAAVWAYRDLVRHLLQRDLRHKYKGSALGFLWSLANPLLMAAVYTVAFKYIVPLPIDRFPLFLVSGLLPWTFLVSGLGAATGAIVDNAALVRKVAFPRLALPVAAVLSQFVQFALTYAVVIPVMGAAQGGLGLAALAIVPVVLLQLVFTAGLGLVLATAYVYARDTRHLLDVGVQLWFRLTPIIYAVSLVPPRLASLLALNPMTPFIEAYHRAVVDAAWPTAGTWLTLLLLAATSAAIGLVVFTRCERRFAEEL
jgi:ABC-type polysaccharide/polyol phosphate export permease